MAIALKIKKLHPDAVIPKQMTDGAAGFDLTAISVNMEFHKNDSHGPLDFTRSSCKYTYDTGLAFEIPKGHVGLIFPRSSIHKTDMVLSNCVGVIDQDYRGPVKFVFNMRYQGLKFYEVGERVGQLVIMQLPEVVIEEVEELSDTARGQGGFGSTNK